MLMDPVILYRGNEQRAIPAIDASAWEAAGWKRSPEKPRSHSVPQTSSSDGIEPTKEAKPPDDTKHAEGTKSDARKKTPTPGEMLETLEQLKKS
jgi:hypothetical protein